MWIRKLEQNTKYLPLFHFIQHHIVCPQIHRYKCLPWDFDSNWPRPTLLGPPTYIEQNVWFKRPYTRSVCWSFFLHRFWLNLHYLKCSNMSPHLCEPTERASYLHRLKIKYISVDNWTKLLKYFWKIILKIESMATRTLSCGFEIVSCFNANKHLLFSKTWTICCCCFLLRIIVLE